MPCCEDSATVYNVIPLNNFDVMILDAHTRKAFNLTCGDKLNLFLNTGYDNQIFSLKAVSENVFAISHNGKCIESDIHGNGYDYVACDGSDNQLFEFIRLEKTLSYVHEPKLITVDVGGQSSHYMEDLLRHNINTPMCTRRDGCHSIHSRHSFIHPKHSFHYDYPKKSCGGLNPYLNSLLHSSIAKRSLYGGCSNSCRGNYPLLLDYGIPSSTSCPCY